MGTKINRLKSLVYLSVTLSVVIFTTGCNDMIDTDTTRLTAENQWSIDGATPYPMAGVFSQLQKLADSYVLLGELRADLMTVGEKSDPSLAEINNLELSKENKYVKISDYYSVINNCNYILSKLDTVKVEKGIQYQLYQYNQLKAIRAWVYMQVALNFKTVKFYTQPILSVDDVNKNQYPELDMLQLSDTLIADLEPLKYIALRLGFSLPNESYFYTNAILGDLYLWRASLTNNSEDYRNAATAYHKLMTDWIITVPGDPYSWNRNRSTWDVINNTIATTGFLGWNRTLLPTSGEVLTTINCPTQYGVQFALDSINNQQRIVPTDSALAAWDKQTYYLNKSSKTFGDMRKWGSISYNVASRKEFQWDFTYKGTKPDDYIIYKYKIYNQRVATYRASILYLRYAEAINRLNKPNMAFAILKYGLNATNMADKKIVPVSEKEGAVLPDYLNFTKSDFKDNAGIHSRGCGEAKDDPNYTFPSDLTSLSDSVRFVESKIFEELGLETAFEGNRFQDLMRFTLRQINAGEATDASFLANKVAAKHKDNADAIRAKLMTIDNWYLKVK